MTMRQLHPDSSRDFVFHEGATGPPGQKGEKGDIGPPGDAVSLPASSDQRTKGEFTLEYIV